MDYGKFLSDFKNIHGEGAGVAFDFSLFPVLLLEFKKIGLDQSVLVNDGFLKAVQNVLLAEDEEIEVFTWALKYLMHYRNILPPMNNVQIAKINTPINHSPAQQIKEEPVIVSTSPPPPAPPIATAQPIQQPKKIQNNSGDIKPIVVTYDYVPNEEDEGDGTYVAPEEILHIKPEECADIQYDWDFIAKLNAAKNGVNNE